MVSRYVHFIFPVSLFCFCCFLDLVSSQLPSNQTSTMTRLYQMIQNDSGSSFPWVNVRNDSNPCSWKGVSCSPNNSSIVQLSLSRISISSPQILTVLCQIDTLESLDVSNNRLSLILDEFITGCRGISGLRLLNFNMNRLSGPLPTFNGFGMLEYLDLSHNSLSGNIGLELRELDSLKSLNLSYNKFTGPVPTNLGTFNRLEELQLSCNNFQGQIPEELVRYGNLSLIDLTVNNISGSLPDRLGELSKLQFLLLSANNLTGGIPTSISNIQTLLRFAANRNNFGGNIPSGITRYLKNLDLSYNNLNGTIPQDFLSQPNLEAVDLSFNQLEGPLPANVSSSLVRLRLGGNLLNGTLPSASFRNSLRLTYLELDNNSFSGSIPQELSLCRRLALLNIAHNRLSGVLPAGLGNLTNLQGLYLQQNNLVGMIPDNFARLLRLQRLNLSSNSVTGSIPESITLLTNLTNLDLRGNRLSGSIPNSIASLKVLLELQLGNNQLSGNIPTMPTSLQIALNLSNNLFQGYIPLTLSRLIVLEVLDLSNNQFSGAIPEFLTTMPGLTQLILSNNQLSGVVPNFKPFVTVLRSGNKDLKNPTNDSPISPKRRKTVSVGIILAVAMAAATVAVLIIVAVSVSRRYYGINDFHLQPEEDLPQQQVIRGNLLTANGIHRSNIDFMKGLEAVADTTNIISKTKFSTYYKAVMPAGVSYLVKKLNWSDKIFQLGNHDKVGEELEVLGRLSNSNVMIPLAYVLTVDSAYLFYDFAPKGTLFDALHSSSENVLNWANRYSIAIGVAQGLAFLHGFPSGSILLLDLCSKNIMLKSLNEPQIGDIEIYKVIDPSKSTASLTTVAGSVGYIPSEYAYTMRVTMAGNVYSFGVILLELLTGRPAVSRGTELAKWVLSNSAQQNKWDHILDFSVSKTSLAVRSQMLAVLKVALACVSVSPDARPKMKSVLRMLLNAR